MPNDLTVSVSDFSDELDAGIIQAQLVNAVLLAASALSVRSPSLAYHVVLGRITGYQLLFDLYAAPRGAATAFRRTYSLHLRNAEQGAIEMVALDDDAKPCQAEELDHQLSAEISRQTPFTVVQAYQALVPAACKVSTHTAPALLQ